MVFLRKSRALNTKPGAANQSNDGTSRTDKKGISVNRIPNSEDSDENGY